MDKNNQSDNVFSEKQPSTKKQWKTPTVEVVTPIKNTASTGTLKPGVESGITYRSS